MIKDQNLFKFILMVYTSGQEKVKTSTGSVKDFPFVERSLVLLQNCDNRHDLLHILNRILFFIIFSSFTQACFFGKKRVEQMLKRVMLRSALPGQVEDTSDTRLTISNS